MRTWFRILVALGVPGVLTSQGSIIPGPCLSPVPPCPDGRCIAVPVRDCVPGNLVVRQSSDVRAELVGRAVRFEVSEVFVNRGPGLGEADYVFPLPAGAAFEDLQLSINGELVAGETMSAAEARRIYEEIVRRRRDPALVEWIGSGLLRARIFPIAPGEEKRVVVRFQTVARREGDAVRIDYVRGAPSRATTLTRVPQPDGDESPDSFLLTYDKADFPGTPYSPTHALAVRDRGARRTIDARGTSRDVTILLPLGHADAAAVSVLAHRADGMKRGFALIAISPPSARGRTLPRDVTFVVDVSGSMSGTKLTQAKAAGARLLASLRREDRFRLIDFASDVDAFREGFVPATAGNLRAAQAWLDALVAGGSTNISGALDAALARDAVEGRLALTVFLTDGEPTVGERNPEAIAARAARERGDARLFVVGVGAGVNAALIEQLALEGHGTAHFVRAGESVAREVSLLAARLATPVLTDVRVTADGVRLSAVQPVLPTDLFAGQDLVLLARYDGDGATRVTVSGRGASGPVTWSTPAVFPASERDNAFIPRLWAAQRLGWLAAERRKHGPSPELDAEIKSLGERYGIPTRFSSYLVLEPGAHDAVAPGAVPLAAGAAGGRTVPATAPAAARFEAAREAAAQRNTRSLAELDAGRAAGSATRVAGNRRFALRDGTWTDVTCAASTRIVRVKAFSPAYFELAARLDGLQEALALDDAVLVCGRAVAIQAGAEGVETMTEAAFADLRRAW